MSFASRVMDHTVDYESPGSFWRWSIWATIAAVARDHIYRKTGDSYVYPNIYVLLLADSGQRKGRPIELSNKLLEDMKCTKVISGRTSVQAILDELGKVETDKVSGKLVKGGSAIFYASELAAGIVSDQASVGILTDIYDFKDQYKHHLRGTGKMVLEKIVFNFFAASNIDLLREVYDSRALRGGLLARTFLIVPDEYRQSNSLLQTNSNKSDDSYGKLLDQLREIYQVKGEVNFTDEAVTEYESWYIPFRGSMKDKKDPTGIYGRIHQHIVKLSMLMALNDLTLQVTKAHMEDAINECMGLIPNYTVFMAGQGKSTIAEAGQLIIADLLATKGHMMERGLILRNHWSDFDAEILDKLIVTFEQSGLIQTSTGTDRKLNYKLTTKCLEIMRGTIQ